MQINNIHKLFTFQFFHYGPLDKQINIDNKTNLFYEVKSYTYPHLNIKKYNNIFENTEVRNENWDINMTKKDHLSTKSYRATNTVPLTVKNAMITQRGFCN